MKPVEHNQHDSDSRWQAQCPLLGKAVRLELSILERADQFLFFSVFSIQWAEIQIRARIRDGVVFAISTEYVVSDNGGHVEQNAANFVWVFLKDIPAIHELIKDIPGVWELDILQDHGLHRPSVVTARLSETWMADIVITAIGLSVFILVP